MILCPTAYLIGNILPNINYINSIEFIKYYFIYIYIYIYIYILMYAYYNIITELLYFLV